MLSTIGLSITTLSNDVNSIDRPKEHYHKALIKRVHNHKLSYNAGNGEKIKKEKHPVFNATIYFVSKDLNR